MKLGVVLRSVAVMLAAPLVALPAGGAQDEAPTARPAEMAARFAPVSPVQAPKGSAALDERRPRRGPTAVSLPAPRPPRPSAPAPVRVSVDCAEDGCVVQDGLDVLVVGP